MSERLTSAQHFLPIRLSPGYVGRGFLFAAQVRPWPEALAVQQPRNERCVDAATARWECLIVISTKGPGVPHSPTGAFFPPFTDYALRRERTDGDEVRGSRLGSGAGWAGRDGVGGAGYGCVTVIAAILQP